VWRWYSFAFDEVGWGSCERHQDRTFVNGKAPEEQVSRYGDRSKVIPSYGDFFVFYDEGQKSLPPS
jgi:hypothetical protein